MKILILLSASLFGFGLVCQDVANVEKAGATIVTAPAAYEEPVATIALDTVEVVYVAPAALADNSL